MPHTHFLALCILSKWILIWLFCLAVYEHSVHRNLACVLLQSRCKCTYILYIECNVASHKAQTIVISLEHVLHSGLLVQSTTSSSSAYWSQCWQYKRDFSFTSEKPLNFFFPDLNYIRYIFIYTNVPWIIFSEERFLALLTEPRLPALRTASGKSSKNEIIIISD